MTDQVVVEYYPKSSAHWYTRKGEPMHTVIAKGSGKPRNTTLTDARKLDLVPSVTTILNIISKPSIINWKVRLAIKAGIETGDPEKAVEQLEDESTVASKRGTRYHKALEEMLSGSLSLRQTAIEYDVPELTLEVVQRWVDTEYKDAFVCEQPFALKYYGGCIDLWSPELTTDFKTSEKPKSWPEHAWQIAAYSNGKPAMRSCILLISTLEPGLIEPVFYDQDQLDEGYTIFYRALQLWQALKKWGK